MNTVVDDDIKRWSAKRKVGLVLEIILGNTTIADASQAHHLTAAEIEGWVADAKKGMENALRAKPLEVREQYEKRIRELQEAYGEAMLQIRALKKGQVFQADEDR